MTLQISELRGDQKPRVSHVPNAVSSSGQEAIELAASAGLILDEWQQHTLHAALGEREDGKWSAFEVGLIVARQNGKGSVLEARELAGLFLFGEQLILHSAHEFKTAAEAFLRVKALIDNTDDLRKRVHKVRTSHGEEGIELIGGQRLRFVARSTGSGRGFTGDCIILDEAYQLSQAAVGALMPVLSSRPNPSLWYTSSAGHRDSEVLRSIRDRGMKGVDPSLCYLEWSADPAFDTQDRKGWQQANPALGIRISEEHVEREYRAMGQGGPEFVRERLGIWDEGDGENTALAVETWLTLHDARSVALDPVAFGVDVSPEGVASISSFGARSDGKFHVEVIEHRSGTSWVVDRLVELSRKWNPSAIVIDVGSPAGALLPDLERSSLQLTKIAGREMAQASVAFAALITNGVVHHLDQPDLNSAVAAAKRRNVGDLWAFGRRGSFIDISPLVACSLAAWGYAQNAGRAPQILDPWSMEDE